MAKFTHLRGSADTLSNQQDPQDSPPPALHIYKNGREKPDCRVLRGSNDNSNRTCFSSFGRARMLVSVRPSNEGLLRARVPGARDQRGCPSYPFIVRVLRATRTGDSLSPFQAPSMPSRREGPDCPSLRALN